MQFTHPLANPALQLLAEFAREVATELAKDCAQRIAKDLIVNGSDARSIQHLKALLSPISPALPELFSAKPGLVCRDRPAPLAESAHSIRIRTQDAVTGRLEPVEKFKGKEIANWDDMPPITLARAPLGA